MMILNNMYKRFLLVAALLLGMISFDLQAKGTIYLQDYLDRNKAFSDDAMKAIREALDECVRTKASELVLPGGTLNVKPDLAYEEHQYISNNDPSMKRIAFLMRGMKNFKITGNGTKLMFTGYISPFYLDNCTNITIEGITIDYTRPFVSEGKIAGAGPGWIDLSFPSDYIIRMQEGQLKFYDNSGNEYPYSSLLEFDKDRREVSYHVHDYWIWSRSLPAVKTTDGNYRFYRQDFGEGRIGNIMVMGASKRLHPAFTLWECSGFSLKDVNIWNCCGMGVIAQSSRDMELLRVNVIPTPGSDRMISISADATHFVNCKGYIRMIDCIFRNQKDDATNIHGWYMAIDKITGPKSALLKWRNSGQYGIEFIKKGMPLELVNSADMNTYARLTVESVKYYSSQYAEVTFTQPLPECAKKDDVVAEDSEYPEVLISGCYIGNNRARGLLIGSRARVVIEKNTFHTPGAAILFEGDGRYWYEQSGVRDVIIRDNVFENCMYGCRTWGSAVIAVGSGIPDKAASRYHKNIVVENNLFKGFDHRIVNLYSVDGFLFKNNKIEETSDYPANGEPAKRFIHEHCDNIVIEQ